MKGYSEVTAKVFKSSSHQNDGLKICHVLFYRNEVSAALNLAWE